MTTIFVSVQTGMVVRDLLRCGPYEHLLNEQDVRLVLLTPGVRDPEFLKEFADERVTVVPQVAYEPSPIVWRLMTRRWRYAKSARMAELMHRLEERFIGTPPAYAELFERYRPALVVSGD